MSGFDLAWLDLREPVDQGARNPRVEQAFAAFGRDWPELSLLDLGAGTGANFRRLAPRLGARQHWRLLDNDRRLLAQTRERVKQWAARAGLTFACSTSALLVRGAEMECALEPIELDLAPGIGATMLAGAQVVTASALLDLVSHRWLASLAGGCAAHKLSALFALTYDGRIRFEPAHPDDERIRLAVNRHQCGDKGFGAALGPGAVEVARALFTSYDYEVIVGDSSWRLEASDRDLQARLIDDWARAAAELDEPVDPWLGDRLEFIANAQSKLQIGHQDLFARSRVGPSCS